jgi:hypothetical protein
MRIDAPAACLVLSPLSVRGQAAYFPPLSFDPKPPLDQMMAEELAFALRYLGESSIFAESDNQEVESYRFLWGRTFHRPISVRLDIRPGRSGLLTTRIGQGETGSPASLKGSAQTSTGELTNDQVESFRALFKAVNFWTTTPYGHGDQAGTAGSTWLVEALQAGQYHLMQRWSPIDSSEPDKEAVKRIGQALAFDLAQLSIPPNEIY